MIATLAAAASSAACGFGDDRGHPDAGWTGVCGNDVPEPGEECDDGNTTSGDGCSAACRTEALRTITLSQNMDDAQVESGNQHGCRYTSGAMGTAQNDYYRAFRLTEHGIDGEFALDAVSFGVGHATVSTVGRTQPATLRVFQYSNPTIGVRLQPTDMEQLASADIEIDDADAGTVVTYPIKARIPAGGTFIVELSTPDHPEASASAGTKFYIGANSTGQARPGYLRMPSSGCNVPVAESADSLGWPTWHIILTATGSAY